MTTSIQDLHAIASQANNLKKERTSFLHRKSDFLKEWIPKYARHVNRQTPFDSETFVHHYKSFLNEEINLISRLLAFLELTKRNIEHLNNPHTKELLKFISLALDHYKFADERFIREKQMMNHFHPNNFDELRRVFKEDLETEMNLNELFLQDLRIDEHIEKHIEKEIHNKKGVEKVKHAVLKGGLSLVVFAGLFGTGETREYDPSYALYAILTAALAIGVVFGAAKMMHSKPIKKFAKKYLG